MIRELLSGTAVGTAILAVLDIVLYSGDVLLSLVFALLVSIDQWLTILSMTAEYVAPNTDWIPQETINQILLAVALIVIGIQIARLLQSVQSRL